MTVFGTARWLPQRSGMSAIGAKSDIRGVCLT